jgi:hypothetical protein
VIGRHHIGLLGASLLALGVLEVNGRRGPGRQLRDERERVGELLRVLAAYAGLTTVELGEIERGIRIPTAEEWAALQVALPELGEMEAPPTEAERSPVVVTAPPARAPMLGNRIPGPRMDVAATIANEAMKTLAMAPKSAKEPRDRSAQRPEQANGRAAKSRRKARKGWA